MYIPAHFEEPRKEVMHALMRDHPLATLVTLSADGMVANHIPLSLSPEEGPFGILRGHVARANPVWRETRPEVDALAVFQGPDGYVSPSWYPTKAEHGRVVPTWNYAAVHASGRLRFIEDADWLRAQLDVLTNRHEAGFAEPWALADAPREFIDKLLGAIVGVEMVITHLSGKWKLSQNQPPENRAGIVEGLQGRGERGAAELAAMMEQGSEPHAPSSGSGSPKKV